MELTHLNARGESRMVDVGRKAVTRREAEARGKVRMGRACLRQLRDGRIPKGDVFATARLAGIMAAKQVDEIIPLCHGLPLDFVRVEFSYLPDGVAVSARAGATARTGVEMEALAAVSIACLTVYDMLKALDKGMVIGPVYLVEKKGGRSGHFVRRGAPR
jgi:cyclic pyranopterin monophosphate synthase